MPDCDKTKMQCNPRCIYFRESDFCCIFDGHKIINWYAPCPAKMENFIKNMEGNKK